MGWRCLHDCVHVLQLGQLSCICGLALSRRECGVDFGLESVVDGTVVQNEEENVAHDRRRGVRARDNGRHRIGHQQRHRGGLWALTALVVLGEHLQFRKGQSERSTAHEVIEEVILD